MLKNIPSIISPQLLKVLCEMGHGDEIVIADGGFPAESVGKNSIVIRADGLGTAELLDAILQLFPLDQYDEENFIIMDKVQGDKVKTPIWNEYKKILVKHEPNATITKLERFEYYERAKKAYVIIATSEMAQYANIILRKGVLKQNDTK